MWVLQIHGGWNQSAKQAQGFVNDRLEIDPFESGTAGIA